MTEFNFFEILFALLKALRWTVVLSLIAFIGGGIIGLILTMMRIAKSKTLSNIAKFYIDFFQGTPLLMQLFLIVGAFHLLMLFFRGRREQ